MKVKVIILSDLNINNILGLNEELFESLKPSEKEAVMTILSEFKDTGKSKSFNQLLYTDYEELPVDIDTFIEDDRFIGKITNHGENIYPYWRNKLRQIFSPDNHYSECLSGNTLIPVSNGTEKTIKTIVDEYKSGIVNYVYSYDLDTDKYVLGKVVNGDMTGFHLKVFRVTFDNGKYVDCTDDHKFLTKDKSYKMVRDLQLEDYIIPFDINIINQDDIDPYYHKIESFKYIGRQNVYDIEVEKYHNFAISSGIIVKNCVFTGAIGLGKTTTAITGMAYVLHQILCLKNPQEYYGLQGNSEIVFAFFNVNLDLSYGVAYKKIQSMLMESPWFLEHGKIYGRQDKNKYYQPDKNISFRIGSQESHSLGQDVFCIDGDTEIITDLGVRKIKDLENRLVQVYSEDKGNIYKSNICMIVKTKEVSELYELILEDGTSLKVTSNHRLKLSNGNYVKAEDLKVGDDIMNVELKD